MNVHREVKINLPILAGFDLSSKRMFGFNQDAK